MKKFFRDLTWLVVLLALGYLGWQHVDLTRKNQILRATVAQLEAERRELQQRVAMPDATAKPEASETAREEVERDTSALRGLPFKRPVTYKMIGRDELHDFLVKKVKEQYSEQEVRDYSRSLAALGLVPEGTDLLAAMVSLYDEQVGAFYEPDERALYTFNDLAWSSGLDKMLLAHEITHALQDQHFELSTFPLKVKDNDDLALATAALIEGDATVLMTRFYAENADPTRMLTDVGAMLGQNTEKLRTAPTYLREMLLFPYTQGQEFAMTLYAAGGNDAIDATFRNPPVCTKHILHPEQFLSDRRDPETVTLRSVASADWRLIGDNVLGEFGIRSLLEQHVGAFDAQRVAQAWNGDRYHVYERGTNGPTGLIWETAWEDEHSAADFKKLYQQVLARRNVGGSVDQTANRVLVIQSDDQTFIALAKK